MQEKLSGENLLLDRTVVNLCAPPNLNKEAKRPMSHNPRRSQEEAQQVSRHVPRLLHLTSAGCVHMRGLGLGYSSPNQGYGWPRASTSKVTLPTHWPGALRTRRLSDSMYLYRRFSFELQHALSTHSAPSLSAGGGVMETARLPAGHEAAQTRSGQHPSDELGTTT